MSSTSLTSAMRADIDRNTTLCLACASSLPPLTRMFDIDAGTSARKQEVFVTKCCQRPICPNCIEQNPRLKRYDPCLACFGGVRAVYAGPSGTVDTNIDGGLRDKDTFVLGDEDSDVEIDDEKQVEPVGSPTPSQSLKTDKSGDMPNSHPTEETVPIVAQVEGVSSPPKYYIMKTDTLQGIALRFEVDGREICRLNSLPPSTLTTTPHLLHTRTILTLPSLASKAPKFITLEEQRENEAQRHRERAEKRLQTLTKEVDWRVAKAYVALADDPDDEMEEREELERKRKEAGAGITPESDFSDLEARAVERYLDDEEWEETQRREGYKAGPSRFPPVGGRGGGSDRHCEKEDGRRWWQWKN